MKNSAYRWGWWGEGYVKQRTSIGEGVGVNSAETD